jgi:DNA-binding MarR family transcriptional regulator
MTRNNWVERTLLMREATETSAPSGDVEADRRRFIAEILDLNREIMREIHRGIPHEWLETEVTMPQFKTLMVLYGMDQATMGDLAESLGTGVSTVTGIVDRLVEHGLVQRVEDPRDRRVVVGRPTEAGVALVDRLLGAAREQMSRILEHLGSDELRRVAESTRLVHRSATVVGSSAANPALGSRSD